MGTNQFLSYQMFGTTVWMQEPGTSESIFKSSKLRARFQLLCIKY